MSAAASWYYASGTDPVGPYSTAQMTTLLAAGVLRVETLVWSSEMTDWAPLYQSALAQEQARAEAVAPVMSYASVALSASGAGGGVAVIGAAGDEPSGLIETLGDAIGSCFGKFAFFGGRASRAECWFFVLFGVLGSLLLGSLDLVVLGRDYPVVGMVFGLLVLTPLVAVLVRRLHDVGWSGWWVFLGVVPVLGNLVLLVLCSLPGSDGQNRFG